MLRATRTGAMVSGLLGPSEKAPELNASLFPDENN
jgi:hypothetical protein